MPQPGAALKMHVLGAVRAELDRVAARPPRNALALVYYLARNGGRAGRGELAGLLWSNHTEDRARANLRVLLTRSRGDLGTILGADRQSVWLAGPVELDIDAVADGSVDTLIEAATLEVLADWDDAGTLFDDWLATQRAVVRQGITRALSAATDQAIGLGQWAEAERSANVLLDLDPWSEAAAVRLVTAVVEQRGTGSALDAYRSFVARMEDELGVAPSPQTHETVSALLGDAGTGGSSVPNTASGPVDSARQLLADGRLDEAVELLLPTVKPGGDETALGMLAVALAAAGRRASARDLLRDHTLALATDGREPSRALEQIEWNVLAGAPDLVGLAVVASDLRQVEPSVPAMPRTLSVPQTPLARVPASAGSPVALSDLERDGAVVLVPGEAGSGKTTLLAHTAEQLRGKGCWVLHGGCSPAGQALEPFAQILDTIAAQLPVRELRQHVADRGRALDRLTANVARRVEDTTPEPELAADERSLLFDAVVDLVNRAGAFMDPVVVIDDLHWAGPATLDLLGYLHRRLERGLVLVGYRHTRPDLQPEARHAIAALTRSGATLLDPVPPFTEAEVEELVRRRAAALHGPVLDEQALAASVLAESAGHALFASELVTHHLSVGAEGIDHRATRAVPASLKDLVWQRADGLGLGAVEMLEAAAVLRPRINVTSLVEMLDQDEDISSTLIDDAVASGLLSASDRDDELQFRHDIVASAVYDDIGVARRRGLHARAGDAEATRHITLGETRNDGAIESVARHYRAAGLATQGWSWEAHAGRLAFGLLDFAGAAAWYELAIESAVEAGLSETRLIELRLRHGEALQRAGSPKARDVLLAVGRMALDAGAADELAQVATTNTRGFQLSPDTERIAQIEAALANETEAGPRRIILQSLFAMELHSGSRWAEVDAVADAAWNGALATGDASVIAEVGSNLTNALWRPGGLSRRREISAVALQHVEALADAAAQYRLVWAAHSAAIEAGDAAGAYQLLATMRRLADESTSRQTDWPMGMVNTFWETMRGDLARAEELVDETFATSVELGEVDGFQIYAAQLMVIRSYNGLIVEMFPIVESAANEPGASVAVEAAFGIMCARAGRTQEATAILHKAVDNDFPGVVPDFVWTSSMMAYSIMANELHDKPVAEQIASVLEPYSEMVAFSGMTSQGCVALQLGMLHSLLGHYGHAEDLLLHSLDVHRGLEWPIYEASSRVALANSRIRSGAGSDPQVAALLSDALTICVSHGFVPLRDTAQRLLDSAS